MPQGRERFGGALLLLLLLSPLEHCPGKRLLLGNIPWAGGGCLSPSLRTPSSPAASSAVCTAAATTTRGWSSTARHVVYDANRQSVRSR